MVHLKKAKNYLLEYAKYILKNYLKKKIEKSCKSFVFYSIIFKKRKTFSEAGSSFMATQAKDTEQRNCLRSISPQIASFVVPSSCNKIYSIQDDSTSFSISMSDSLRLMTPATREYAKMRIQQVIYECAYGKYNNSGPPSFEFSGALNGSEQSFNKGTSH